MVKLIGLKRIILLAVLLVTNGALAAAFFLWIEPMRATADRDLNRVRGDISKLRIKISGIKEEMKTLKKHQKYYDGLFEIGFMTPQDPFFLKRKIAEISDKTRVAGYKYRANPVQVIEFPQANKAGYQLYNSRIELKDIKAYTDADIYHLMHLVNTSFPGQTRIQSVSLHLKNKIDEVVLKGLASKKGDNYPINAELSFDWQTLVPIKANKKSEGFGSYFNQGKR